MTITRLPITTTIDPEKIDNGIISAGAIAKNALFEKYLDGRVYATQRPNLSILSVAGDFVISRSIPNSQGRGIYYWGAVSSYIIVNNNKVFFGDYSLQLAQLITGGKDRVFMAELGTYLIILDAENNQGWYINSSAPLNLIAIPFIADITTKGLAGGGAVLNGVLYVLTKDKYIYNSNSYDPTVWNALNFVRAEREYDQGIYLTKHHDHIAAFGSRSIEFFYDAGNPVGSPLGRRDDTAYRIGPVDYRAIYSTDDIVYFIGSEKVGGVGFFKLEQFAPTHISTPTIDAYLSIIRARTTELFIVAGYTSGTHPLIFISQIAPNDLGLWRATYTLVYDRSTELFTQFSSAITDITNFGVMMATSRSTSLQREPEIIMETGDIGILDQTTLKQDTTGTGFYFSTDDYILNQNDYILTVGGNTRAPFEFIVRVGESDMGSVTNKFQNRLSVVGTTVSTGNDNIPLLVSWSDDHFRTFSAERPLDTGLNRSLTRGGTFRRRAFQVRYFGTDALRIEGVEVDVRASRYA